MVASGIPDFLQLARSAAGWYADRNMVSRHVMDHHCVCSNHRMVTHNDWAK
jgi:hypothetical protein